MLRANLDRLCLQHLAHIEERLEVSRLVVLAQHISSYALIATSIFLVRLHDRRDDIEILRLGELMDCLDIGEGLKSVLRHEARELVGVFRDGLERVPHSPVVHVAIALTTRSVFKIRRR